jgi:hypothetical protein
MAEPAIDEIEMDVQHVVRVVYVKINAHGREVEVNEVLENNRDLKALTIKRTQELTRYCVTRIEGTRETKLVEDCSEDRSLILKLADYQREVALASGRKVTTRVRRMDGSVCTEVQEPERVEA